jgi:alpha-D-xyloside xylohydrolase
VPLLVRPDAVVPVGGRTDRPDYNDAVAPTFEVFGLADGGRSVIRLCDGAGAEHVVVEVSRTGAELRGVVTRGLEHLADG